MSESSVNVDTTFKQFVEEKRGLRLAHIKRETSLYRMLVKDFNWFKQAFIALEEREIRQKARLLLRVPN